MLVPVKKLNNNQLADAIDLAINEYLWDGVGSDERSLPIKDEFSCPAISRSLRFNLAATQKASSFIQTFGCRPGGCNEFEEIEVGEKRQYARALWLTFAAMIAREDGL